MSQNTSRKMYRRRPSKKGADFRASNGRNGNEKVPCPGAATMSDEEFSAKMWGTLPTAEDVVARNKRPML